MRRNSNPPGKGDAVKPENEIRLGLLFIIITLTRYVLEVSRRDNNRHDMSS